MSAKTLWLTTVAALALLAPASLPAAPPRPAPKPSTGLEVGEKAPKFALKDQEGKTRTLDEFLKNGKGRVALVFYRSADW